MAKKAAPVPDVPPVPTRPDLPPMRRATILKNLFAVALLGLGGYYFSQHTEQLAPLQGLRAEDLAVAVAGLFLFVLATGYTFFLMLGLVEVRISAREVLGLTYLSNFVNYLAPVRPGAIAKAVYLKLERDCPFTLYTVVVAANTLLVVFTTSACGLFLVFYLWWWQGIFMAKTCLLGVVLCLLIPLPLVLHLPTWIPAAKAGRRWELARVAAAGFAEIRANRRGLAAVCLSVVAQYVASALLMQCVYSALGFPMDLPTALLVGMVGAIFSMVTLTPGNLGVQELVMGQVFELTGLPFAAGVLGSGVIRALHIGLTLGLTPLFCLLMFRTARIGLGDLLRAGRRPTAPLEALAVSAEAVEGG
jgi:uncharacterized membrane protein YbhN (UPF0104 family)